MTPKSPATGESQAHHYVQRLRECAAKAKHTITYLPTYLPGSMKSRALAIAMNTSVLIRSGIPYFRMNSVTLLKAATQRAGRQQPHPANSGNFSM